MFCLTKGIEETCFQNNIEDLKNYNLLGQIDSSLQKLLEEKSFMKRLSLTERLALEYLVDDEQDLIVNLFFTPAVLVLKDVSLEEIHQKITLPAESLKEFSKHSRNSIFFAEQELTTLIAEIKKAILAQYFDTFQSAEGPCFQRDCFNFFFEKLNNGKYNATLFVVSKIFRLHIYHKELYWVF